MKRESFKSRLGFILISAGCAVGIGNVWKFPYVTGQNGGGIFVLFYLLFLIAVGVPVLTMEFAVGRASKKSVVGCYQELEKKTNVHVEWEGVKDGDWTTRLNLMFASGDWPDVILRGDVDVEEYGNYMLMMFYTTVSGWMLSYFYRFLRNDFKGLGPEAVAGEFSGMLADPYGMAFWMAVMLSSLCSSSWQN